MAASVNGTGERRLLLPTKTLDLLVLQTDTGDLTLHVSDRHVFFVAGSRVVISRQLEAAYPNYERIIPRENANTVILDRFAFAAALRRVRLLTEETHTVSCALAPGSSSEPGTLDLSATQAQVGHADERIPVQYDGASITFKVSAQAILDMLDVAVQPEITITFKDERTNLLLLDGESHLAVILPTA